MTHTLDMDAVAGVSKSGHEHHVLFGSAQFVPKSSLRCAAVAPRGGAQATFCSERHLRRCPLGAAAAQLSAPAAATNEERVAGEHGGGGALLAAQEADVAVGVPATRAAALAWHACIEVAGMQDSTLVHSDALPA